MYKHCVINEKSKCAWRRSRRNLEKQHNKVKKHSESKYLEVHEDTTVLVQVSEVDRGCGDTRNIEVTEDGYYQLEPEKNY